MIDLDEIAAICGEYDALFHSDTVQTAGHFPIDVSKTRLSFMSGGAHKFHGPKGVGFIYINNDNLIQPMMDGGGQERNMRGGTENIYGIMGMAKALEIMLARHAEESAHIRNLRDTLRRRLSDEFDDITFNGDIDGSACIPSSTLLFPPSERSDMLLLSLDIAGVSASGGSACSSGAETRSHVLDAIGAYPDRKAVRFSFSAINTMEDVDIVVEKLKALMPVTAGA